MKSKILESDLPDARQYDDHDRGTWELYTSSSGEIGIISSDFTFDAVLYVNGDFGSLETKREYAQRIADRLNRTIPK